MALSLNEHQESLATSKASYKQTRSVKSQRTFETVSIKSFLTLHLHEPLVVISEKIICVPVQCEP